MWVTLVRYTILHVGTCDAVVRVSSKRREARAKNITHHVGEKFIFWSRERGALRVKIGCKNTPNTPHTPPPSPSTRYLSIQRGAQACNLRDNYAPACGPQTDGSERNATNHGDDTNENTTNCVYATICYHPQPIASDPSCHPPCLSTPWKWLLIPRLCDKCGN